MTMTRDTSTTSSSSALNDTTIGNNNSSESVWSILERLNHERALYFLPAIIWVMLLMLVGIFGNILVIYVYRRRFKRTSSNYFILTMAIFDLVACLIGMPTEIYDLFHHFTFYSEFGCKIFRTTENFTIYGSVVVLVEIAFDRYFKICRPLMVVSLFKIKILCVVAVITALLMAAPSFVLYGITRPDTPVQGVKGYDCSISEEYRHTAFQSSYFICLAVVFVVTLIILTVLYVRIWLELRQRRRMVIGDQLAKPRDQEEMVEAKKFRVRYVQSTSDDEVIGAGSCRSSATQLNILNTTSQMSSPNSATLLNSSSLNTKRSRFSSFTQYASRLNVSRTTVVLFAVTVAFVLSFLPALSVMIIRTVIKDFEKNQSMGSMAATKIFSKFNFINNAINPIIYSFLNINFRRQARKAVEKLLCCLRPRQVPTPHKADSDRSTKKEFLQV